MVRRQAGRGRGDSLGQLDKCHAFLVLECNSLLHTLCTHMYRGKHGIRVREEYNNNYYNYIVHDSFRTHNSSLEGATEVKIVPLRSS